VEAVGGDGSQGKARICGAKEDCGHWSARRWRKPPSILGAPSARSKPDCEVKGIVMTRRSPELEPLAPHIEIWCKWFCTIPGVKTDDVAVTKTRWLRKFDTSKYVRSEIPLGANERPKADYLLPLQGCNVELTEIEIAGHAARWWTLGFKAFGDLDSVPTNLTPTVLPEKPLLLRVMGSGAFLSYPVWLSALGRE
jgi:hypothetical protein